MANNMYPTISEENVLSYLQNCEDVECKKYCHSFLSENIRRDETEKNAYRKCIIKIKKQTKLSAYKLCKLANINSGNYDSFFNKGNNNKLSLKKCRELMWILKEYQS